MAFEVDKLDSKNTPVRWRIVGKDLVENNPSQLDKLDPVYKAVLEKAATFTTDEELGVGSQEEVTPEPEPVLVTGITVSTTDISELELGSGIGANLAAAVLPIDADDATVVYTSGDEAIATVSPVNGLVTAVSEGIVTITATANDGSGVTGTFDIAVVDEVVE